MANINLSQKSFTDYVASMYFKAMNVINVKFSFKAVTVGEETVPLLHIEGVQTTSGVKVDIDLWPRNHATDEDLKVLFKRLTHIEKDADGKETEVFDGYAPAIAPNDIEFRIGYWAELDENGEPSLRQGTPKWTAFYTGLERQTLSGDKREFEQ